MTNLQARKEDKCVRSFSGKTWGNETGWKIEAWMGHYRL